MPWSLHASVAAACGLRLAVRLMTLPAARAWAHVEINVFYWWYLRNKSQRQRLRAIMRKAGEDGSNNGMLARVLDVCPGEHWLRTIDTSLSELALSH